MKKIEIKEENVIEMLDARFVRVFDLQYEKGKHYYDATRRKKGDLVAIKSDAAFQSMLPDAVTCIIILKIADEEPKLLFSYEYRYPVGQFLLSPAAGLIDKEDQISKEPLLSAAKREILEETGLQILPSDRLEEVSRLCFSTPGMTDESNGFVLAVFNRDEMPSLDQGGAVGTEVFNGFQLLTKKEAREVLKNGRDKYGNFFSIYTWSALTYFVSDLWKE